MFCGLLGIVLRSACVCTCVHKMCVHVTVCVHVCGANHKNHFKTFKLPWAYLFMLGNELSQTVSLCSVESFSWIQYPAIQDIL